MSLINDMLKDLEQRPSRVSRNSIFKGLKTDISKQFFYHRPYYFIIGLLSLVLVFFGVLFLLHEHQLNTFTATAQLAKVTPPPAPIPEVKALPTDLTRLSSIAFQVQQDTAFLRFLLNQVPLYQVSSESVNHEITITFQNTHLVAAIPKIDYSGSGLENITAINDNNNNLKLILKLNPNADVKRLELSQDGGAPELQMEITYHPLQTGDSNSYSVKKAITESPADQQYQHALALASADRTQDAITLLQGLIIEFPRHDKAREYLAGLLLQENNSTAAEKLIIEGLQLNPDYPPYIKLEAHLLMERDELKQAIALLEKKPPTIAEYPDYHALLAALYQRTNQTAQAANLYRQLLALEPSNAKWWVGLGVALESNNDPSQALDAFVTANNIGGLSPTLKSYLDTQLNTLSS
jgi:Flp pilus assembly protein TadD